jgi:hypothetical protein
MKITIRKDGRNYGPYSLDEVRQHLASGSVALTDLVFIEGASEWTTLNLVSGITSARLPPPPRLVPLPPPPPPPVTSVTGTGKPEAKSKGSAASGLGGCLGIGSVLFTLVVVIWNITAIGHNVSILPAQLNLEGNYDVMKVKNGTLKLDNTVKIGSALEGYSFFKNVIWKGFKDDQGRRVVEATAIVDIEAYRKIASELPAEAERRDASIKQGVQAEYTVQFKLSQSDNTIVVGYSDYTIKGHKLDTGEPVEDILKDEREDNGESEELKNIFANRSSPRFKSFLLGFLDCNGGPPWQTGRQIAQMMFDYSTDNTANDNAYPDGNSSTEVFQKLLDEKYCTDPAIFYLPLPGKVKPIAGQKLKPENVCWDVTSGVDSNAPDKLPLIFMTGYKVTYAPGAAAVPLIKPYPPYGSGSVADRSPPGIAVFYKGNNAMFLNLYSLENPDGSLPNFVPPDFDPTGKTYRQLTPDGPLP